MGVPRIIEKVYREPWLIKPSVHGSISTSLLTHIKGEAKACDFEDEYEEYTPDEVRIANTAIIPIHGIIGKHLSLLETTCGAVDVDDIAMQLDRAVVDDSVDSIVLYFDTAGGTVTGIPELADKIARANEVKPVVSYTDSLCASAGYWLASQGSAFYCSTSAEVGSVGVYMMLMDESQKLFNEGVKVEAFSAGKYKLSGSSFQPLTQEERVLFQADIDYWYELFKKAVLSKRELADEVMQGQTYVGEKAVTANMVDGLCDDLADVISMTTMHY